MIAQHDISYLIPEDYVNGSEILDIENKSFGEFAWTETDFQLILKQRCVAGRKIVEPKGIIGYFVYELNQDNIEILNLAISESYRRQGYGTEAVNYLKHKLGNGNRYRLNAQIIETNLTAQLFLRDQGFRVRKICRQHYRDILEDSYLFSYSLTNDLAAAETVIALGE